MEFHKILFICAICFGLVSLGIFIYDSVAHPANKEVKINQSTDATTNFPNDQNSVKLVRIDKAIDNRAS